MDENRKKLTGLIVVGPIPPPSMGPAVATRSIIRSQMFSERFSLQHVDITDRNGHRDIGRWSARNIALALHHGWITFKAVLRNPRSVMYLSLARGALGLLRDSLFVIPSLLVGMPVVMHLRCGEFTVYTNGKRWIRFLMRQVFGRASRAIYLSDSLRGMTGDLFPEERKEVAHNGINREFFYRRELRADRNPVRFCCVANLYRDKGTHVVLEALGILKERTRAFHMTFAGWWHDELFKEYCLDEVREQGLEELVTFHEPVILEGKRILLYDQDVTIFCPVEQEGMPWTVLEGMASNMPVISTPQGSIPELVHDGENGFLVPVADPAAVAEKMQFFIEQPGMIDEMGQRSRALIESTYNEEASLSRLADILEAVHRERFGAG